MDEQLANLSEEEYVSEEEKEKKTEKEKEKMKVEEPEVESENDDPTGINKKHVFFFNML